MLLGFYFEQTVAERTSQNEWIASLCSFVVHLFVLLGLAAWTASLGIVGDSISIEAGDAESTELQLFELDSEMDAIAEPQPDPSQVNPTAIAINSELTIPMPTENTAEAVTPVTEITPDQMLSETGAAMGFSSSSLDGRKPENRAKVLLENGGTAESEQAVENALAYLAAHQRNDGSWSMLFREVCDNECRPSCSGLDPHRFAATGLALLCYLGAGKTDRDERYGEVVSKGIYYLIQNLRTNSSAGYWVGTEASAQMYEHGIATLALCEAYQMLESQELKESSQLSIQFIVDAQFRDGSWDYHPGSPGDLSIVGWQVMALKSAVAAKIRIPQRTLTGVDRFLDEARAGEFMYRYRTKKPTASMTAIGTLLQLYRGKSKEAVNIGKAMAYLAKQEPSESDLYYDYYATQAMFLYGGPLWKQWNYKMREYLIRTQEGSGHSSGSWWFDHDLSNTEGGRLYSTCMACLILEVYYRYLPVYEEPTKEFRF